MKAVNLLPSDRGAGKTPAPSKGSSGAGASAGSPFGAYVILGVLAFAVVAMAAFVLTNNTIKDRKAEVARVTAEADATKRKAAALQPFADFKQLAEARVSTVQGLASSRFDWENTLRDISRAIPREARVETMKGSTGTMISGGGTGLRSAIQSPAIELTGCTVSQAAVARLMSRLRAVRGVTRVALSKSDKGNSTVASVAPVAGGAVQQQLCKGSGRPKFEMVMFFERAAVNQNAVPNAGDAGTGGNAAAPAPQTGTPDAATTGTTPAAPATTTNGPDAASNAASNSTTQGVSAP